MSTSASKGSSGGAVQPDSVYNRLNHSSKERRSLVRLRACDDVHVPWCLNVVSVRHRLLRVIYQLLPMLTPLWQVSSKDVASIIGPSRMCIVPRSGVTGCSAGRADSPFALSSRPTPPPPPPPEWMDPDVHDVGLHPQLAAAPSAVEAVIEAAAAQAGDLKLSSAFVAGSGSADVRTLALPLGVACYFQSRALFAGSSSRDQTSGGTTVISCAGVIVHKAVE